MNKRLFSLILCLMLMSGVCLAFEKLPEDTDLSAYISRDAALDVATQAALENGIDFSALPLIEIKTTLVYNNTQNTCQWIITHIVEGEAIPYLSTAINAETGEVMHSSRANYLEIHMQWEEEMQLSYEFWAAEDQILFDTLYRKSVFYPRTILPSAADMPLEDALRLAEQALQVEFNISAQELDHFICAAQLMENYDGNHHWLITYNIVEDLHHVNMHYQVTLNAETGEIILCLDNANPGWGMANRLRTV